MNSEDFVLESVERSQLSLTRRRRSERSRRRQVYALTGLLLAITLTLCTPSFVSHSSLGRSILIQTFAEYGFTAEVETMRIGWITPLRATGLRVEGEAGTRLVVDQLDVDLTVTDLLGKISHFGEVTLRGVNLACRLEEGNSSLEQDLAVLLASSAQSNTASASVKLQDLTVAVTDSVKGGNWQVTQSSVAVETDADQISATFAGVLTEPSGSGGSLQGDVRFDLRSPAGMSTSESSWEMDLKSESLPLSVMSLVRRRFPETAASIPAMLSGDATGSISLTGSEDGSAHASIDQLQIRNLRASDEGSRVWSNSLATVDGQLILLDNRVIGKQLQASTDFASLTIDGAFSRTFSLVGANDNPLRWLEAIDGTATAEVDLAAFDQSLPGLLPLRDGVQLLSGRIFARLDSSPESAKRSSRLHLHSDELRGWSQGRAVVIEPIELSAVVSSDSGVLTAEQFRWTSTFGTALGQGNLRAGNADFDIDFGRLSALLRPFAKVSETSLAGLARGKLEWSSAADGVWRLSGDGTASNLLLALAKGRTIQRQSLQGRVTAVGRWGNQTLDQLSKVTIALNSDGLDVSAELAEPVTQPATALAMPFRIRTAGRLETLYETIGPWLPTEVHRASGGFTMNATASFSSVNNRLTSAAVELINPQVAYGQREFTQPNIKIHFDGEYVWPTGSLDSRSFTIAGDAFSVAAKGSMTAAATELEIKWRAKLERIQGSVMEKISTRTPSSVRQVSFTTESVTETLKKDWLLMGDCEGSITVTSREQLLDFLVQTDGTNLAIVQPPQASAEYQTIGPPRPGALGRAPMAASQIVWSEPNLNLNGHVSYDTLTNEILADAVQVAGDWFATTLTGQVAWNTQTGNVQLDGPARIKMTEVANRLSSLAGIEIKATGIQQTPLSVRVMRRPDGFIGLTVAANLGWESGEVAGIRFGPASIPVKLDESSVSVATATIPVDQGSIRVAGQIHYRPGPLWMRVEPGVLAESIRLTPEQTNRWLKYVAPLVANSTKIDGMIGVEIDEALIVFDQPEQSRVAGRLNVGGVQMMAGPLAQQIIAGVNQLKSISAPLSAQDNPAIEQTLITMPPQTIGFTVNRGLVSHDRLFMEIDRAQVVTSGQVSLDGQLEVVAQVPLDPRWLGRDLQGLAGQPVTLQIDGTLSRPSLDSASVRQIITQLGAQAVQSTAESYLQQQINRGLDSLFGR